MNAENFKQFIQLAITILREHENLLNSMNVFPVADGDTGRNIYLTMKQAFSALENTCASTLKQCTASFSKQLFHSCRGNGGNITAQFFAGFDSAIPSSAQNLSTAQLIACFKSAYTQAYQSVSDPQEGTALTVMKSITLANPNTLDLAKEIFLSGTETLISTRHLLPILKDSGMVDAGGLAFILILQAFYIIFSSDSSELKEDSITSIHNLLKPYTSQNNPFFDAWKKNEKHLPHNSNPIEYCCEFLYAGRQSLTQLETTLKQVGNSLIISSDPPFIKVHLHTIQPDFILSQLENTGSVTSLKIDNMNYQHQNFIFSQPALSDLNNQKTSFLALAPTQEILDEIEHGVSAFALLSPSTIDLVANISSLPADDVVLLYSHSLHETLAQKAALYSYKKITLYPLDYWPQFIHCAFYFNPDLSLDENLKIFNQLKKDIQYFNFSDPEQIDPILIRNKIQARSGLLTIFSAQKNSPEQVSQLVILLKDIFPGFEIHSNRSFF